MASNATTPTKAQPRQDIHFRGLPTELRGLHVLEREDVQAPLPPTNLEGMGGCYSITAAEGS